MMENADIVGGPADPLDRRLAAAERTLTFCRAALAWEHERSAAVAHSGSATEQHGAPQPKTVASEQALASQVAHCLWRIRRRLLPDGTLRSALYRSALRGVARAARAVRRSTPDPQAERDARAGLVYFERAVRASGARRVAVIVSGTQLVDSEGQRPTQIALAFSRRGIPVVFLYWRWSPSERRPQDRFEDGIIQIPLDVAMGHPDMVTSAFAGLERLAFFEFPYPEFFAMLAAANGTGWITVYDALDDWQAFQGVGQANWYDEAFERHLVTACDAVFVVNDVLADRVRALGGRAVEVVGNGASPGIDSIREPRPLPRGEMTVGYIGYLAQAWFDWELIAETARRRPAWRVYLVGYGERLDGIELPPNIHRLGKQRPADLAAYAANWDVAVVPFKPGPVAAAADPIKIYEYLAMGLPVVTTGVTAPAGAEVHVVRAGGVEGFVREIERAGRQRTPRTDAARRAYAAGCTWDRRADTMLTALERGSQRVKEKRALFEARR